MNNRTKAILKPLSQIRQEYCQGALVILGGNISETARVLGIDRKTLKSILREDSSENRG